ncbi:MAG: hypothetical protein WDN06_05385 [Asticcacaulis sp.]
MSPSPALKQDEAIPQVRLLDTIAPGGEVSGKVNGAPIVMGRDYLMFENPPRLQPCHHGRGRGLDADRQRPAAAPGPEPDLVGRDRVTAPGQLRRDFLGYVEAERAHPYRTFLHYNSWYDIGYDTPYTEADALDRIHAFGEALTVKRGVRLDSFLFDDGWDDLTGTWNFSKAFPNGFVPLRDAAAKYGAAPGAWLSPVGRLQPQQGCPHRQCDEHRL